MNSDLKTRKKTMSIITRGKRYCNKNNASLLVYPPYPRNTISAYTKSRKSKNKNKNKNKLITIK